jgi:uncharacterized protein
LLLLGVGVVGGAIGSAGGITSFVSYPALLAVGLTPLVANVSQAVAFAASWPGSMAGSRPELRGQKAWLMRWALLVCTGGAVGVVLLLCLPSGAFASVVPYLLGSGSVVLLLQPLLARQHKSAAVSGNRVLGAGLFAVSVYSGYFGAGAGIITLALLLSTVERDLPRANAFKNVLLGMADVVAAVGFAVFGPVRWAATIPLAIGLLGGSSIGPSLTRRVPPNLLRVLVALAGLGLAIRLWVHPA